MKDDKKLTLEEIEKKLDRRAKEAQEKFRRLEEAQIVTDETMRREFKPVVSKPDIIKPDKTQ